MLCNRKGGRQTAAAAAALVNCKVDYINNNISECFISWVSRTKNYQIVDMHDKIRQMIIEKNVLRVKLGRNMPEIIISSITNALNVICCFG